MSAFSTEFGVCDEVEKALQTLEWFLPTDVQSEACPLILGGGDVLMAAETGSGKTGAFCIPVVQIVLETLREKRDGSKSTSIKPSGPTKMAMNVWDRSPQFAISPDGLLCQSREQKAWQGCRATYGVANQGKWYYEATVTDEGLCRVGWSTSRATFDLGCDNQGFGFGGTGKKSFSRQFDDYGEPFGLSDTVGCFLDFETASIKFSKNGTVYGKAFGLPGEMMHNTTIFPACTLKNAELKFNFGHDPFKYPPGNGFQGLANADSKCLIKSLAAPAKPVAQSSRRVNSPQALILEPSKELAEQTNNCINTLKQFCKDPAIRSLCCVGGANIRDQIEALESGVDIVTGTPGRLGDLISNEKLDVRDVRFFILDEADGLLQQQHGELIQNIWKKIPQVTADNKRLQVVVCSATLHSREVKQLADKMMHFPVWVDLKGQDSVPDTVHNVVCMIDPTSDLSWQSSSSLITTDGVHRVEGVRAGTHSPEGISEAVKLLKGIYVVNAIRKHNMDQAIIFCRTRLDCDNMERFLWAQGGGRNIKNNPFACACLHGDKRNDRAINLEKFKQKEIKFLICTDVAARGLDIGGLPYMISVTMPPSEEKQTYVHRIGRVGRAERMGLAIALVSKFKEKVWYHQCPSRGKNCSNVNLVDRGGCCKWYDEPTYLGEIEEHLGVTIPQIGPDMHVEADEFAGKVVYGQKVLSNKSNYNNHVTQLAPAVRQLAEMETLAQKSFLSLMYKDKSGFRSQIF